MSAFLRADDLGRLADLARASLTLLAIVLPTLFLTVTLAVAGSTLGYDFLAYHAAAARVLSDQALYDTSFQAAGGFGLFYYPPFFAPLILPFGVLPAHVATWLWIALLLTAFVLGTAILPVSARVKLLVVLLAGVSWPFLYGIKLGQVGPILYLTFAVGWRWRDDPRRLGASTAIGAAIKLQPGLMLVWALLAGRWRAVAWGAGVLGTLGVLATILAGPVAWSDFLLLIRRVSDPIATDHNFTPGSVAFQMGLPRDIAGTVQVATTLAALGLVVWAARRATAEAGYLVTVVASQLVSPILWDHYAMLLLLPVAWLLDRRHWWAALVPMSTAVFLVDVTPPITYPLMFALIGVAVAHAGRAHPSPDRERVSDRSRLHQ